MWINLHSPKTMLPLSVQRTTNTKGNAMYDFIITNVANSYHAYYVGASVIAMVFSFLYYEHR